MKLVLDIETQNSFKDIGGKSNLKALKISLVGVYWYGSNKFLTFMEDELDELEKLINSAESVTGFNLFGFDYLVLESYLKNTNFSSIKTLDIMDVLQKYLGYRVKLESVAQGPLKTGKSGTGLEAIEMWRNGKIEDLKKYCLQDVEVTKNIYEYGVENKNVKFKSLWETYDVPVEWY